MLLEQTMGPLVVMDSSEIAIPSVKSARQGVGNARTRLLVWNASLLI